MKEACFVKYYGLLVGSLGQVVACGEDDQMKCNDSICIVMERGAISMDKYLLTHQRSSQHAQLAVAEKMLAIVVAAHTVGVVLMDFKFSNIVRFVTQEGDVFLKAIDFGSSCSENDAELISGDTTPTYSCPEIAKYMLAQTGSTFLLNSRTLPEKPKASHKMDVMALGWMVFELANDSVSYWKSLSPPLIEECDIINALSELTDKDIQQNINFSFPGEKNFPLRSWLCHALKVNPNQRASASELQAHSLFGSKDRTLDESALSSRLNSLHLDMQHSFEQVTLTLEEMNVKLDVISNAQNDFGLMIRQVIVDGVQDHQEVRKGLFELVEMLSVTTSTLQKTTDLDEMKDFIQSAMSNSLSSLQHNQNLTGDIKEFLVETFKEDQRNFSRGMRH